jgi:UDP-glucose 4-epimerase
MLSRPYCPKLLGFDPLLQVIDERDVATAIHLALKNSLFGVFNVAGEGVINYSKAIEVAGTSPLVIPPFGSTLTGGLFRLLGYTLPAHLFEYLKYPVIVSDQAFRKAVPWKPQINTMECLQTLRG